MTLVDESCLVEEVNMAYKTPSVRVLDDFLEGGKNATVGYQCTHRPAMLDNVAASMRAMSEKFPEPMEFFQTGPWSH